MTCARTTGVRAATTISLIAASLIATGLVGVLAGCDRPSVKTDSSIYSIAERVTRVDVSSRGGRIVVVAGAGNTIEVTETTTYTGREPQRSHDVQGADLKLTNEGCANSSGACGVDYRVQIPADLDVHLDSDGGAITVQGTNDDLDLRSGGGSVTGDALAADVVAVQSAGGDTQLVFATAPTNVDVNSSGGDATLRLPSGPYAFTMDTDGGHAITNIDGNPNASRLVHVATAGGTLTVNG